MGSGLGVGVRVDVHGVTDLARFDNGRPLVLLFKGSLSDCPV